MPQSNVIAQVNAKSQGTTQNHWADCASVLSQRKLKNKKKKKWSILFWIIQPELSLLNCSRVPEKNVSGRDYLYCPWCHMDFKLRRNIRVRDLSAIRPSTVWIMFILTGFYWHTQATSMKEKVVSFNLLCGRYQCHTCQLWPEQNVGTCLCSISRSSSCGGLSGELDLTFWGFRFYVPLHEFLTVSTQLTSHRWSQT